MRLRNFVERCKRGICRLKRAFHVVRFGDPDPVEPYRERLARSYSDLFNNTVAYGPFKGLRLSTHSWWQHTFDRAAMCLGIYEQEVLTQLVNASTSRSTLVNIGAADGYYAVGAVVASLFTHVYCFESTAEGRAAIQDTAAQNNSVDKITIFGTADISFYTLLPHEARRNAVFLIDVEGAEYELLDKGFFSSCENCIYIIELHAFVADADNKILRLRENIPEGYVATLLTTGSRDLSVFPELRKLRDTDRWLLCSEGRPELMQWLIVQPVAP